MKPFTRQLQVLAAAAIVAPASMAQVNHVAVIGVDGLSPDGVLKANAAQTIKRYRETRQQPSDPKFLKFCYGAQVIENQS